MQVQPLRFVINNVAIRSVLDRGNTHEINLADEMLKVVNTNDLLICIFIL